jgi:polyisoprenyl-teichoic acid--peptidoglycan teichoic acid transferase
LRVRKRKYKYGKGTWFFRIIFIISLIIFMIFSIMLSKLDMIPFKYLLIFYIVFGLLYLYLLFTSIPKKIKFGIKVSSCVVLDIFSIVFGIGIKYLDNTMDFVNVISKDLSQNEVYYVMVLEDSKYEKIKDLKGRDIGIYSSKNSENANEKLNKKIENNSKEYKNVVEMFEDLRDSKLDAVLINGSTRNLLDSDLADMDIDLKEIYKLSISIEKEDIVKVVDVTKKTFNIFVAGGDAYGSIDNVTNTDVNMIITVDPVNKKLLLTSIPRDYYVNLPSFGDNAYDKLTHAGYYGIEESVKAVENLLDVDINYYVKVNFSTIVGVIDAIGGVDVESDYKFCIEGGGPCFKKGNNYMNGTKALAFARERHSFKDGDVQRVKNQQKVLMAIIDKASSSTTIITNFSKILDSVSDSFSTNMETKDINKLVKMQLNDMSTWSIESQNLVGTDLYSKDTYTFPNLELYVMKQDTESVNTAKEKIKGYLNK